MRSAVIRSILIMVFYTIQIVHYLTLETITDPERLYHREITLIAACWLFVTLAVWIALKGEFFPTFLKYLTTGLDVLLVGLLAWLGQGPTSPMVLVWFLVLAVATLRFQIGLIWFSTIASMVGYMLLVGSVDKVWFDSEHTTPLLTQAVTLCALGCTGVVLGQIIRSTRTMADAYLNRSPSGERGDSK
jgi:hypothetical protein